MKTQFWLAPLIVVLLLSGCVTEQQEPQDVAFLKSDLIGTWGPIEEQTYDGLPYVDPLDEAILMFYEDFTGNIGGYTTTYQISGNQLTVFLYDGAESMIFTVQFDSSKNLLSLSIDDATYEFQRINT